MTGYSEGKHDDPADTKDRLIKVGSKYQASTPNVADGDNVYLLVDAAGRPLVSGAAAHDAAATGSPLRIGGVYRSTLPSVTAADIVDLLTDAAGRLRIEDYLVQQSRLGNEKSQVGSLSKTSTSAQSLATWTVTNGKDGYLSALFMSIKSHASETEHIITLESNSAVILEFSVGQGDKLFDAPFAIPFKLVGDGAKSFDLKITQATTNLTKYKATLRGWEE